MKRNEKILEAKQSENTVYLFRFGWKRKIQSKKKRNEAKKNYFFSRERAKRMRNGSRFATFRFEAKIFLKRNRRTLSPSLKTDERENRVIYRQELRECFTAALVPRLRAVPDLFQSI
jgi:hypothetical protein